MLVEPSISIRREVIVVRDDLCGASMSWHAKVKIYLWRNFISDLISTLDSLNVSVVPWSAMKQFQRTPLSYLGIS